MVVMYHSAIYRCILYFINPLSPSRCIIMDPLSCATPRHATTARRAVKVVGYEKSCVGYEQGFFESERRFVGCERRFVGCERKWK